MDNTAPVNPREHSSTIDFQSEINGTTIKSKRIFGVEIECIITEEGKNIVGNAFPDVGIIADGGGYEFQTPLLSGIKGENYIKSLGEKLLDNKAYVKESCGLHIHLDGGKDFLETVSTTPNSQKTRNLRNLLVFLVTYEGVIQSFLPYSRRYRPWTSPLHFSFQEIQKCPTQFDIEKYWYNTQEKSDIMDRKNNKKGGPRPGFNLSPFFSENHIEIRYHSGTVNPQKIIEWVNLFTTIMDKIAEGGYIVDLYSLSRAITTEEKTALMFQALGLAQSSVDYFIARQRLFTKEVVFPKNKIMENLVKSDTEILA